MGGMITLSTMTEMIFPKAAPMNDSDRHVDCVPLHRKFFEF